MKILITKKITLKKGLLVAPIFEDKIKEISGLYPTSIKEFIKTLIKEKEFKGKFTETIYTYIRARNLPSKFLVIGLGDSKKFKAKHVRKIGAKIAKIAKQQKVEEVSLVLSEEMADYSEELMEGLYLAQYEFDVFKSDKKQKSLHNFVQNLHLITAKLEKDFQTSIQKAKTIAESMNLVKDLVNSPSNHVHSERMAQEAKKIAKENDYKIEIFSKDQLSKFGWGGILAVNQGAKNDPKCLILKYFGAANKSEKPIVIIGKGVIFDTGGYNLKPSHSIETMHQDMAGAATVLGLFNALKKIGIKKNVIGITPIAENLVSSTAYRPSDIIKMYSGKTVEITNTDAEGRLILADAITYAAGLNPQCMITIATLTGAVAVALGDRYAGLIGNDKPLREQLQKAGQQVDDLAWPLPLHSDFKKKMKSEVADLKNCDLGTSRLAGSSKGAAFLERFVEGKKWCHIDIGGTAYTSDPLEFQAKGATAHGFRMLLKFLEN